MSTSDWGILLVIAIWLIYKHRTSILPEKVSFLYYTNVKPGLYRLGFEGCPGDVTEERNYVESLYYLKSVNLAMDLVEFDGLKSFIEKRSMFPTFSLNDDFETNEYQISFEVTLNSSINKATLSLHVNNRGKEKELGMGGAYLSQYIAPIHYFNSANLNLMLANFFFDIQNYEQSSLLKRKLHVYGLKLTPTESINTGRGLPLIYPNGEETSEKSKKSAYKIIKKGYANSIVATS